MTRVEVSKRFPFCLQPEPPEVLRPKGEGWVLVKTRMTHNSSGMETTLWTLWEKAEDE